MVEKHQIMLLVVEIYKNVIACGLYPTEKSMWFFIETAILK